MGIECLEDKPNVLLSDVARREPSSRTVPAPNRNPDAEDTRGNYRHVYSRELAGHHPSIEQVAEPAFIGIPR